MSSAHPSSSMAAAAAAAVLEGLQETLRKVGAPTSGLSVTVQEHVSSQEFDAAQHGLDFLHVKNTLLLSYLIDLVYYIRHQHDHHDVNEDEDSVVAAQQKQQQQQEEMMHRLTVIKVALDKMRGLDKKLKYQIDKLMAAAASVTASSFAATTASPAETAVAAEDEDPLNYQPNVAAMDDDDDEQDEDGGESDDDTSSSDNEDEGMGNRGGSEAEASDNDDDDDEEDIDDDLAAARMTLAMADTKSKSKNSSLKKDKKNHNDDDDDDNLQPQNKNSASSSTKIKESPSSLYRAPRLQAVPYSLERVDEKDKEAERERRFLRRLRASELAETLRHVTAADDPRPEQDDMTGGTEFGKQRAASRKMAAWAAEKEKYEEDAFVRLTTSRKEKKAQRAALRQEGSNLAAIANLGNLVRDVEAYQAYTKRSNESKKREKEAPVSYEDPLAVERLANGKRRSKPMIDADGKIFDHHAAEQNKNNKKRRGPKNELQAALYGDTGRDGGKKKKKSKK